MSNSLAQQKRRAKNDHDGVRTHNLLMILNCSSERFVVRRLAIGPRGLFACLTASKLSSCSLAFDRKKHRATQLKTNLQSQTLRLQQYLSVRAAGPASMESQIVWGAHEANISEKGSAAEWGRSFLL